MKRFILLGLSVLMSGKIALADVTIGAITNDNSNKATAAADGLFYNYSGGHVSQNFEASQPIPYLPGTPNFSVSSPTLFSLQGLPAQVTGLPILSRNFFSASRHDVAVGCSGGTKIIYNSSIVPKKNGNKEGYISINLSGVAEGELIGSMTIQSRKNKADEVDFSTLMYDAAQYVSKVKELQGYNVTLLTMKGSLSYTLGVDARSSGFSLSPLLSGLINGPTGVMAGLASGFSKSGGVTVPTALVGCTFLVLVDGERSSVIDLRSNSGLPEQGVSNGNGNGNGNGKKKYEALQKDNGE